MIEVSVPTSKSVTQRALVLGALAPGLTRIVDPLHCDDSRVLLEALSALGVGVRHGEGYLEIHGGGDLCGPQGPISLGNAGTAVRFVSSMALLASGPVTIRGDEAMARRPMPGLLAALGALGARVEEHGAPACPPVTIHPPGDLTRLPGEVVLDASGSSQQVSGLMLVAPRLPGGLRIVLVGRVPSRPYVDLTAQMLRELGATVHFEEEGGILGAVRVLGGGLRPRTITVEGDHSSASYLLAAGFLTGLPVRVTNTRADSLQGDRVFGQLLDSLRDPWPGPAPRVFDMTHTPDIAPTLATCALFAQGSTRILGCAHLRIKESDRLAVLSRGFRALGADLDEEEDGLCVRPRTLAGNATLDPAGDHRMAMCFALLGLRLPNIRVADMDCVTKSYPGFFHMLERFGPPR